jgi:predicted DNA-binding mobile mystery protein A
MTRYTAARAARRSLDARRQRVDAGGMAAPRTGWVAAVRLALGMSSADLGVRLHVSRQAVAAMEASERAGTVRMSTLAAAAEALGCRLVYAIVPLGGGTLESIVQSQAGRVVDIERAAVAHSMALEDQAVEPLPADRQDAIDDLLRSPGRRMWQADLV